MKNKFVWSIRVYYEDTDCGGVVYHSNYLKFMEQARTEWLRHLGLEQDVLRDEYGIIFAVRSLSIDYLKPAAFNQLLSVETEIEKAGKVSLFFKQKIFSDSSSSNSSSNSLLDRDESCYSNNKELLSQASVKIVSLNFDKKSNQITGPKKLPTEIFKQFSY